MAYVLIIDDDALLRKIYETLLSSEGFTIDTASDGIEGYRKIVETHPDLVLLDVMLPGLTGLEILDKMAAEHHPLPPIISFTNLTGANVCSAALSKGAKYCLIKDQVQPKELIQTAKKLTGAA